MCVFFGLGDAQLGQPSPGNHLAEGIREILRREQRAEKAIEPGRVLDEPERCGKRDWLSPWEVLEIWIEQGSSDFAHSIGAKVRDQHPVAVFHPAVFANCGPPHDLVGSPAAIGSFYGFCGSFGASASRLYDGPISLLHALPALIAIHRKVATGQGRDPNALEAGDVLLEIFQ